MGQAPRQQQRQQGDQQTPNQQISTDARAQDRMKSLLLMIRQRRDEIEAVLPPDVAYSKFEAVFNMAIRREPKLLDCYGPSIIKAVIQSAYDGLLPDGNQAVILYSNNKIPGSGEGNKARFRLEARYQSMVYGIRLKLVEAGAVTFIDAKVVFANEHFVHTEGLDRKLEHTPILDPATRGDPIAVYAMATLPNGDRVFDVLSKVDVMAAREVAKTKNVWDGPFKFEMWKKTAIRRLAKAIPSARPFRDAEALEMFPQFSQQAQLPAPSRPTRNDYRPAQLEHREEVPLDLNLKGFEGGYETEESRLAEREEGDARPEPEKKKRRRAEPAADEGGGQPATPEPAAEDPPAAEEEPAETGGYKAQVPVPLAYPSDAAGWRRYADDLKAAIPNLANADAIVAERQAHQDMIDNAPSEIANELADAFADALADLV